MRVELGSDWLQLLKHPKKLGFLGGIFNDFSVNRRIGKLQMVLNQLMCRMYFDVLLFTRIWRTNVKLYDPFRS